MVLVKNLKFCKRFLLCKIHPEKVFGDALVRKQAFLDNINMDLSNDPGKKGSNLFCCGAIRFPHIDMFSFSRRECINLQKGSLRKKMYLNSTFKGCVFVLKHFDQSQELQTMAKKCSQFYVIRTYDFCVT